MPRAVRFDTYGDEEVLRLIDVPMPAPGPGQLVVRMRAAGINPGEAKIRAGLLHDMFPATFPSGQGSDLAGTVEMVGPEVTGFAVGDPVIAYTDARASHAGYVLIEAADAVPKPARVPWEVAGALFVAGTTAYAAVRAVALTEADTCVVAGAAGGVGSIAVQLARRTGARVIGLAGAANHDWLRAHGVLPVRYGDGTAERIREAAGGPVDAFIDTVGSGYVELALALGVAPSRINTIADFPAAEAHGVMTEGNAAGGGAATLRLLADLVADGELEVPIARAYPLAAVQDAYRELARGHTRGKIVLVP